MPAPGIVTPEGVVLDLDLAGVGSRLVAHVIDLVAQAALVAVLLLASVAVGTKVHVLGEALVYLSLFVVVLVYPAAFETIWPGRTPGKWALGLRVVTVEGAPIRFRHAAIRAILGLVDFYLLSGLIAVLAVALTNRHQRLGDLVAGTVVLRLRRATRAPAPAQFFVPPGWEAYAASLDVSAMSAADYGAVRAFLLRAGGLEPRHRFELARQIAIPMLATLHHTPEPWVGPEMLLLCIATAYQHRQRAAVPGPGPAPTAWGAAPLPTPARVAPGAAVPVAPPLPAPDGFAPPA